MAKKIINIRLEESVWKQAKKDAVDHDVTLQDWITLLILRGESKRVHRTGLIPDPEVEVEVNNGTKR